MKAYTMIKTYYDKWEGGTKVSDGMTEMAMEKQVAGTHYKKLAIQPMEYSMKNNLNSCQHTIVKYVTRYKDKNGIEDLKKAIHCIEMLMEFEYGKSKGYNE